jgi:hypothetical protein
MQDGRCAKMQTPVNCLTGVWNCYGVVLDYARLQNTPSRMAPTNAKTARAANTSSLKARFTVVSLPLNEQESSKGQRATEVTNVLQCGNRANTLG